MTSFTFVSFVFNSLMILLQRTNLKTLTHYNENYFRIITAKRTCWNMKLER